MSLEIEAFLTWALENESHTVTCKQFATRVVQTDGKLVLAIELHDEKGWLLYLGECESLDAKGLAIVLALINDLNSRRRR